ncbi:uncharacterized protein LOC120072160 [Benincasa hispida]|uniref:uncharacterized protein LOC120072160 n=1 Tax=Benincasa hispida TaxID=102211 RepID=UPI0018FF93B5|nr:uncharacterized protein LOC120072160 [Benincasa hispida]
MSEGKSSTPQARADSQLEDAVSDRIVQDSSLCGLSTTDPAEAELWLDVVEKCFNVMGCPEDRKVGLAAFLLLKGAEKWWKVIFARRASTYAMLWPEFRKAFEDKYYPSSFRDEKRDEFLRLT